MKLFCNNVFNCYYYVAGLKERKALEESIVEEIHESETEMDVDEAKEKVEV